MFIQILYIYIWIQRNRIKDEQRLQNLGIINGNYLKPSAATYIYFEL